MRRLLLILVLILTVSAAASAQERGVLPQDYYDITSVSGVQMSPSGNRIVFVVTAIVEEKNARHREIWLQQVERGRPVGEPFRLTDPTAESSSPQWSPDGSVLQFSSRRGDDRNSIWFVRMTAPSGAPYHVSGVDATPRWSPDGQWIAFTRAPREEEEASGERDRREGWVSPAAVSSTLDKTRFDGRVITSMRYKRDGTLALLPDPSTRDKSQLFVVPSGGGEPRQITDMPFNVRGPVWSTDGSTIFFGANPEEDNEYNRENTNEIYAVSAAGGEPRVLTTNPGSESDFAVSPDGRSMAYSFTADRGSQSEIMVVDLTPDGSFSGEPRMLTGGFDLVPRGLSWTPDGRAIRFSAGVGGNMHLFEVAARGGEVDQITTGDRRLSSISPSADGRFMAYASTDAVTPADVFIARSDGSDEIRITSFNDEWLASVTRMPAERLTWPVGDGTEIEGWVIKPVGYVPGRKYPMILKIHGGPYSAYGNTFFQTFHVLSNTGFFVLYTNPRGSTGYGHAYQWATQGAWGEVDSEDYLGGVEAAVAKYPDIDADRVGVSGGSYGGFMSNWLSSTTDRFSAVVTSRSIANWESWYGDSDAQGLTDWAFYGPPWEQRELYRKLSPISYVENVTAPTLIIHSENDYRTPIGDAEQWFMALKRRGVPVELVRYPRSSHGLSRTGEPWLLVDRLERIRSWFKYWLIDHPPGAATQ